MVTVEEEPVDLQKIVANQPTLRTFAIMNIDYRAASSPLSQLVLIKSPYLQLPHPVSLPYNYTPLPSGVDTIVRIPFTAFPNSSRQPTFLKSYLPLNYPLRKFQS